MPGELTVLTFCVMSGQEGLWWTGHSAQALHRASCLLNQSHELYLMTLTMPCGPTILTASSRVAVSFYTTSRFAVSFLYKDKRDFGGPGTRRRPCSERRACSIIHMNPTFYGIILTMPGVKTQQVTRTHTRQEQTHYPQTNPQTKSTANGARTA